MVINKWNDFLNIPAINVILLSQKKILKNKNSEIKKCFQIIDIRLDV